MRLGFVSNCAQERSFFFLFVPDCGYACFNGEKKGEQKEQREPTKKRLEKLHHSYTEIVFQWGRQTYVYCFTFAIRIQDTQYGLSSELHDKWFANVQSFSGSFLCRQCCCFCCCFSSIQCFFLPHSLALALDCRSFYRPKKSLHFDLFPLHMTTQNVNLSIYYAIFNQKDHWNLTFFVFAIFYILCFFSFFVELSIANEFYCPWNVINYLPWASNRITFAKTTK